MIPPRKTMPVTHHVDAHLFEAFLENASTFLQNARGGTTAQQRAQDIRAQDRDAGLDSLMQLVEMTRGDSGQCRTVACFLAGLYNGQDFPFDLTDLRGLDADLFEHCMAVLRLDHNPTVEIHKYIPDGDAVFRKMLEDWNLITRPAPPPAPGDYFNASLYSVSHAPGNRDASLMVVFDGAPPGSPPTHIAFSAEDTERIAQDLTEIHRFAWSPRSTGAVPIDVKENERMPMWLR